MITKKGISASPGVAIGSAFVLDTEEYRIPRRTIDPSQVSKDIQTLEKALEAARQEMADLRLATARKLGPKAAEIFAFHEAFISDPALKNHVVAQIEANRYTAAYAFSQEMNARQREFHKISDPYLKERVRDLYDIEKRVLRHILGKARAQVTNLTEPVVIVAHDLSASQVVQLDSPNILAFALDAGGSTSHMAIIARMRGIPTVVALSDVSSDIAGGETIIVDGAHGIAILDPDEETLAHYRTRQQEYQASEARLSELRDKSATTPDGCEITLMANIELASEAPKAMERGCQGIGLYRTEFIFLQSTKAPSEQEQYEVIVSAMNAADGRPVTVRTIDLGADKMPDHIVSSREPNPALGFRSLRYCLQHLDTFKTHLRAILRASANGDMRIMFPMITTVLELRQAKSVLTDVMEDLEEEGVPFGRDIPLGIMIETPAAALMAKSLAREVSFFSIGTNDLTQYTLAVDRGNERVAHLFSPHHPSVLRLIREVVLQAKRAKIDVSLCGEMAGEPIYCQLLVGLGLRTLSMTPKDLPEIKKIIRLSTLERCEALSRKVLTMDSERQVLNSLRDELRNVDPEAV